MRRRVFFGFGEQLVGYSLMVEKEEYIMCLSRSGAVLVFLA